MRFALIAAAAMAAALPLAAQQAGSVTFDAPSSGGAPSAYRLFRDSTDLGAVTAGAANTVATMFPANTGTWTFAIESRNAACGASPLPTCPRVTRVVTLGPPPLQPPGPVINVLIQAPCAVASPPTCSINVTLPTP